MPSSEYSLRHSTPTEAAVKLNPNASINDDTDEAEFPLMRLIVVSASWIGIQSLWGTEFSITTPYMTYIGMKEEVANFTWIWGPITGFIVAPLVGAASDRCESRWGRRRPFIIGGLLSMSVFAFLFGLSGHIFGKNQFSQIFALLMFIGMDATINVMQTPVRALVSDLASTRQQATGQLLSVCFQGVGGLVAAAVMHPFAENKAEKVFPVIATALGINFALITLACFAATERVYVRPDFYMKPSVLEPFVTIYGAIRRMPTCLQRVSFVQFFSWFALFCMWTFKSTWWGTIVFKGATGEGASDIEMKEYGTGTSENDRIDIFANALQTMLAIVLSFAMEKKILKSIRVLYSAMLAVGAAIFYVNFFGASGNPALASVTMSLISIPILAINSFPFALLGADIRQNQDREIDTGVQFGVLNWFIVIPQILVVIVDTVLISFSQHDKLFLMVAISWTLAAIAALFVRDVVGTMSSTATATPARISFEFTKQ